MLKKTETEAIAVQRPYIAVVGAVNVDLWGRSYAPLIPRDSNPGEIRASLGGVGGNIAHNLRRLGAEVELVAALGEDDWARRIEENCRTLGIGLRGALRIPDGRTSTYLCISGPDGEPALAICDVDISKQLTPEFLETRLPLLNGAALVVMDSNLTAEAIDFLTSRCTCPIFADPISVTKAAKLAPVLDRIHTLKPNTVEAEALTGEANAELAARALVKQGVKRAFVSDGVNGIYAAEEGHCIRVPSFPAQLKNATGCGDSALAALCRSFLDGRSLENSARYAAAAGAVTAESDETVSPAMSAEAVENRIKYAEENTYE